MPRLLKQVIYGLVLLSILGLIAYGFYAWLIPKPTCFDQAQNQGEEGVDCGEICGNICLDSLKPLEVRDSHLLKVGEEKNFYDYDALFKVVNHNNAFGASEIEYEITLFDGQDVLLLQKRESSYLWPGQTKFIYEPLLRTNAPASRADLKITRVEWEKLRPLGGEVRLVVLSKEYSENQEPGAAAQLGGEIFNDSDFDFDRIDMVAVAYRGNKPVLANRTDLRTFLSRSKRYFEVSWADSPQETPDRFEVEAATNLFSSANFLRRYGTQEKFQRLY